MAHEQVGIGGGHTGVHGRAFDLEEMMGVEGEVVVGKDKLCELNKELSGFLRCGEGIDSGNVSGQRGHERGDVGVYARDNNCGHDGVRW